jgi:sulfotransferase family protein
MLAQLSREYVSSSPSKSLVRLVSYSLFEGRPITTRGRWINPLVFAHLGLWSRVPGEVRVPPVFVVGQGRSGTTILGEILSLHPDLAFLNEPKAVWHAAHGAEDVLGSYVALGAPCRYRLGEADASPDVARRMRRIVAGYLRLVRHSRMLDKSPEALYRIDFLRTVFPGARFVALIRRGWDNIGSISEWCRARTVEEGGRRYDWWGTDDRKWRLLVDQVATEDTELGRFAGELRTLRSHEERAAVEWILMAREIGRVEKAGRGDFLRVHFEDLTRDPRATILRILRHSGLRPASSMLEYSERVLRSVPERDPVRLPEWLGHHFREAMLGMGYDPFD